jgi:hypothetical protein
MKEYGRMSWIDERLTAQEKAKRDWELISAHGEKVYDALWQEIADRVAEAKNGGMRVSANGSTYERIVLLGAAPTTRQPYTEPQQLKIVLKKDEALILVSSSRVNLELSLAVCPDGVVCIQYEGREVVIPEASRMILEPFLFPPAK